MARNALKNILRMVEATQATQPVDSSFLADLQRSIELDAAKESRPPSQAYHPSSMNCIRNMWYQITGTEQDPFDTSYSFVGICNSGSDIHERIQRYVDGMKDNGMDCEYIDVAEYVKSRNLDDLDIVGKQGVETKLYHKKLNMSFLCDGIIRYKGKYYILELKTEAGFKWTERKGVDPKHYNQGIAYSVAFGIDNVIFLYISRDVLSMKAYMFEVTDDMRMELIGKIEECDEWVQKLTVPPKPVDVMRSVCNYCNYKSKCEKAGDGINVQQQQVKRE